MEPVGIVDPTLNLTEAEKQELEQAQAAPAASGPPGQMKWKHKEIDSWSWRSTIIYAIGMSLMVVCVFVYMWARMSLDECMGTWCVDNRVLWEIRGWALYVGVWFMMITPVIANAARPVASNADVVYGDLKKRRDRAVAFVIVAAFAALVVAAKLSKFWEF